MSGRPCKRCGRRILFLTSPAGKPTPVHTIRTLYRREGERLVKLDLAGDGDGEPYYVSHFETCPYAPEFSGKRVSQQRPAEA
jgi:hypothetical protein